MAINSRLCGFGKANSWNNNTKKFEIKKIKVGDWIAVGFGIGVQPKDKEGNKTYGKSIDVIMTLNSTDDLAKVNFDNPMVIEGFFTPNNYTTKDGKEVQGNQFKCHINDYRSITIDEMTGKSEAKAKPTKPKEIEVDEEEMPW